MLRIWLDPKTLAGFRSAGVGVKKALFMDREVISQIKITESGELFLAIVGKGNPTYQYVYREASGVYWDNNLYGFKSTPIKEWSCSQWFFHIVAVVKYIGVDLQLSNQTTWQGIPEKDKNEIMQGHVF